MKEQPSMVDPNPPMQSNAVAGSSDQNLIEEMAQDLNAMTAWRKEWEEGLYKTSNDALYQILEGCLKFVYRLMQHSEGAKKQRPAVIKLMDERLAANNVRVTKDTPLATKVIRCVFSTDRKRAYTYSTVIRAAISEGIQPDGMVAFISGRGGIEEIRLKKPTKADDSPPQTSEVLIEKGTNEIAAAQSIGTVIAVGEDAARIASKGTGLQVALVEVDKGGSLVIKWIGHSKGAIRLAILACAKGQGVKSEAFSPQPDAANDAESAVAA